MKQYLSILGALLVASVTSVASSAAAQEIKGDAQAGSGKVAMCIGCHGIQGYQASFPEVYKVPKISGQNAPYIASALQAYKKGERRHPTMRGIADSLSDQDIADVAAYYANQAGQGGQGSAAAVKAHDPAPDVAALIAKGACFSCHGEGFAKPLDPSYPKVAGQYPDYLFSALKAYQHDGAGRLVGRSNAVMAGMAKQFTTAELKQLAGYIGSLPGPLQTIPEQRFR
ncbi:MAG: cytochrome c4 [Acidovorax sp.]|jgi:cytochrome c553|nr:cytochrome c4 [Acidovorax sp.]